MNKEHSQQIRSETLLTSYQVGTILQVNPSSVNKWVKDGRIPAFRTPGGHRRIRASDLVAFLQKHDMPVPSELVNAARRRLLIIHDDARQLESLHRILKPYSENIDIKTTSNSIDALVLVGSFKPNAVLIDAGLPGMDGIEICRRLKSNVETQKVDVVLMSAHLSAELEKQAASAGAAACLGQPIDVASLLNALGLPRPAASGG